jgi:hypothetical protein
MDEQPSVLQRRDPAAHREAAEGGGSLQGDQPPPPDEVELDEERGRDYSWAEYIATLRDEHRAELQRLHDVRDAKFAEQAASGLLKRFEYYRLLRRLPVDHVAYYADVPIDDVFLIEAEKLAPTSEQAERLAAVLRVDVAELFPKL